MVGEMKNPVDVSRRLGVNRGFVPGSVRLAHQNFFRKPEKVSRSRYPVFPFCQSVFGLSTPPVCFVPYERRNYGSWPSKSVSGVWGVGRCLPASERRLAVAIPRYQSPLASSSEGDSGVWPDRTRVYPLPRFPGNRTPSL